ncbi:MAG TPA: glycine--tRNA ligase [Planctomycetota bacterium]|nr:glycine--tRNA ligase [Planctomycetota bacterium]
MIDLDTIVSLCKRRGFIFQSSEIYGGLGSAWDYGPLGVELKRNVKNLWWRENIQTRDDMVGLDAAITMHPMVWKASGHADNFADPFTTCKDCEKNYRADHADGLARNTKWFLAIAKLPETPSAQKNGFAKALQNWAQSDGKKMAPNLAVVKDPSLAASIDPATLKGDQAARPLATKDAGFPVPCPNCGGRLAEPKPANLMLTTVLGPVEATGTKVYLRPETAQGIFVNFDNVLQSSRKKLPFGIGQVGKSFRNEITPGNFTFRTREFEQMEIEYFCKPGTEDGHYDKWVQSRFDWYVKYGIKKENLRTRDHDLDTLKLKDGSTLKAKCFDRGDHYQCIARGMDRKVPKSEVESFERGELAHYAKACTDVEYLFPMGWSELEGIASRTDYDLTQHSKFSGKTLDYFDEETKTRFVPYVVEPAAGADRAALAFLVDAYREEEVKGEKRVVLGFHPEVAPIKVAVLPLLKKNDKIVATAKEIVARLRQRWFSVYDDTAAIGKLYRRQDEVGTPFCFTVDVQTVGDEQAAPDHKVTIRERDSMQQIRVPIADLEAILPELMAGRWSDVAKRHPAQQAPSAD